MLSKINAKNVMSTEHEIQFKISQDSEQTTLLKR